MSHVCHTSVTQPSQIRAGRRRGTPSAPPALSSPGPSPSLPLPPWARYAGQREGRSRSERGTERVRGYTNNPTASTKRLCHIWNSPFHNMSSKPTGGRVRGTCEYASEGTLFERQTPCLENTGTTPILGRGPPRSNAGFRGVAQARIQRRTPTGLKPAFYRGALRTPTNG